MISKARKVSHPVCNHKALAPPKLGRGGSLYSLGFLLLPAALCGNQPGGTGKGDLPPMLALHQNGTGLAAHAAFPSGLLASTVENFDQLITDGRLATHEP